MQSGFMWRYTLLSMVVQVVTEVLQRFGWRRYTLPTAVVVGVIVALTTQTGLLAGFGVDVSPAWVDFIFMGFALAGGGWAANLLKKLMQAKVGSTNGNSH